MNDPCKISRYHGVFSFSEVGSNDPTEISIPVIIKRFYQDRSEYAFDFVQGDGRGNTWAYHVLIVKDSTGSYGEYVRVANGEPPVKGAINNVLIDDAPFRIKGIWLEDSKDWEVVITAKKRID